MNWPITASSRHNSTAVTGGLGGGLPGQADGHREPGRDHHGGDRGRDGRPPDRSDPHAQAGRYLNRSMRLQDGQRHPAAADQRDNRGLRGRGAAGPPDADRGRRGAMTKARRGQPCLHRHSADRGGL
jgi:hypothetical protein